MSGHHKVNPAILGYSRRQFLRAAIQECQLPQIGETEFAQVILDPFLHGDMLVCEVDPDRAAADAVVVSHLGGKSILRRRCLAEQFEPAISDRAKRKGLIDPPIAP